MFGLFGNPSKSKFAKMVIDLARKQGVTGEFVFDEAEFTIRVGSKQGFLGNVYEQYCAAKGEARKRTLDNFVSILTTDQESITREDALEKAVAVVRERALLSFMDLYRQIDGTEETVRTPSMPVSAWYTRTIAIDFPKFVRLVTDGDLKEWDISFDELFEVGLENLQAMPKFRSQDGYYVGEWDDDYDSSRILLPTLFEDIAIEEEPVFCIPNRLTLMVADSAKPNAVIAMLAKAEEVYSTMPRPQNPSPMTYGEGELQDYSPAEDSPAYRACQRAKGITALNYYTEQKALLEKVHEKMGKDIFVATFKLVERNGGEIVSYAVWSKGIPTLLPQTDLVMFVDPEKGDAEGSMTCVRWRDVVERVSDLMLDTEMFPVRYYVSKFPEEEVLRVMPKILME